MRTQAPWGAGPTPAAVCWIPHALSLCGLTCGFLSLIASVSAEYDAAAIFIVTAVFFDGFDGAAARALRCEGRFGEAMDSLADLVAFGVAPAFLVYQSSLHLFGTPGAFAGAAFAGCGAIRLARFPLVKARGYFVGLPIPMAGAFIAMLGVFASEIPAALVPSATLGAALLMVSTIHFPKMGTALGLLPPAVRWGLCMAVPAVLFVVYPRAILGLLVVYLLTGPASEVRFALDRDERW